MPYKQYIDSNLVAEVTAAGERTEALQPAFLAGKSTEDTDATGDSTLFTITYDNEIFDQNGDYDGTNTFTSPVTGRYAFHSCMRLAALAAGNTQYSGLIVTSNRNYRGTFFDPGAILIAGAGGVIDMNFSCISDMDAADTCVIKAHASGGAQIVDATVTTTVFFGGYLVA